MATGRPHLLLGGTMRVLLLIPIFLSLLTAHAFAFADIVCGINQSDLKAKCTAATAKQSASAAYEEAMDSCTRLDPSNFSCTPLSAPFSNTCTSAYVAPSEKILRSGTGQTEASAQRDASAKCSDEAHAPCIHVITVCDLPAYSHITQRQQTSTGLSLTDSNDFFSTASRYIVLSTVLSSAIGLIIALLIYAQRTHIINFIIHGNLPYKLETYGDDIRCVFKRTQRVNWYGRVIFGIAATLVTTADQLADVRKYWLGRVVAFDSLRRQRQNELAKMHLQLAKNVQSEAKDTKPLSQLLAALKFFFFVIFYLIRALFSFLFGFLFIRVTIARLVRGTVIESKDLTLVLQAKEAIEQSATYLKEYLTTANTFDGRGEVV